MTSWRLDRWFVQYLSTNPIQLCKLLPGIANLIALMAITKICPAYNNPVRRKTHLWKKAEMVLLCEHITHFATSFDTSFDTPIHEFWTSFNDRVQQEMINRIPLKWSTTWHNKTWENTDIKRLAQRKKVFTKYWSGERDKHKNHLIRLEKQLKQETRVDCIGNLMDILYILPLTSMQNASTST